MLVGSIFADIPQQLQEECCLPLLTAPGLRIERIVSRGHSSADGYWYDQPRHEWVLVIRGKGIVSFEDGRMQELAAGDYLLIPAHCRHRVDWTEPDSDTIWLAVHFDAEASGPA